MLSDVKPAVSLLIIDDNLGSLELLSNALAQPGLEILTASDPEEGVNLFFSRHPEIVLTDLVMPHLSGMEVLERIIEIDPSTDVILMTAHYSSESAVEAIQKGASDYLNRESTVTSDGSLGPSSPGRDRSMPNSRSFWSSLGFVVIQGYGLTETAPIVSFNNPFAVGKGTVGEPVEGTEIKIAVDGEVLVRGDGVTPGYFGAPAEAGSALSDGWLHTGDIGDIDDAGRLVIRGRKKEVIVKPEGLKVFPEDVERVLNKLPGVRESAVVGRGAPARGNDP